MYKKHNPIQTLPKVSSYYIVINGSEVDLWHYSVEQSKWTDKQLKSYESTYPTTWLENLDKNENIFA